MKGTLANFSRNPAAELIPSRSTAGKRLDHYRVEFLNDGFLKRDADGSAHVVRPVPTEQRQLQQLMLRRSTRRAL
ncbi:hypothetical protein [Variovorax sp.]|uniref:hypothetical protein n=1 Tax=Variovorax sp. TaxID=1871043 RepID=UPI002D23255B|nr:hypothetical protein [Variovorax sp.]HYP85294.1 hypothetical protein [Variovorax sp.]